MLSLAPDPPNPPGLERVELRQKAGALASSPSPVLPGLPSHAGAFGFLRGGSTTNSYDTSVSPSPRNARPNHPRISPLPGLSDPIFAVQPNQRRGARFRGLRRARLRINFPKPGIPHTAIGREFVRNKISAEAFCSVCCASLSQACAMPTSNVLFSGLVVFSSAIHKHSRARRRYSFIAMGTPSFNA